MNRIVAALAVALAAGLAWLYAITARELVIEWFTSADASYGLILGGVALALVWQRRSLCRASDDSRLASAAALGVLAAGLAIYLAGLFAADQFATRISSIIAAAGLIWFLGGADALRAMAAPLCFLVLAIPLPQLIVNASTLPLQLVASGIAETALNAAGVPVFRDGNVLELPSVTLQIVEACSGLRSAISLVSVGVFLAWLTGGAVTRRLLLVAAAVPIAVFMNGMRVMATGLASEHWGPEMTRGTWHTATGWLTFVLSLALLLALERALPRQSGRSRAITVAVA
jgi:exosortase